MPITVKKNMIPPLSVVLAKCPRIVFKITENS